MCARDVGIRFPAKSHCKINCEGKGGGICEQRRLKKKKKKLQVLFYVKVLKEVTVER